jgi:DNA-binding FrmR family transcriptional regulator
LDGNWPIGLKSDAKKLDVYLICQEANSGGAINSLMAELMEDHIRNHMPRNNKSSEEATEDLIAIVRTYLK